MQMMLTLLVVAARALVPAAEIAPLERGWVSVEAEWMVHADVEAWNASTIGSFVMEHAEDFDIDLDELDDFQEATGLDPREDLFSVTVYGWGSDVTRCV